MWQWPEPQTGSSATESFGAKLRKQSYDIAILPVEPMAYRRISIISRDENELSVAAKTFIRFLIEEQERLP